MNWKFIARDYGLNCDADWEKNVASLMCPNDRSYPLYAKEVGHGIVGWLIIFGN